MLPRLVVCKFIASGIRIVRDLNSKSWFFEDRSIGRRNRSVRALCLGDATVYRPRYSPLDKSPRNRVRCFRLAREGTAYALRGSPRTDLCMVFETPCCYRYRYCCCCITCASRCRVPRSVVPVQYSRVSESPTPRCCMCTHPLRVASFRHTPRERSVLAELTIRPTTYCRCR